MRRYIIRRLLLMPITLIGITFIVFCLTRIMPGGPVERMLQEQAMAALSGDKALDGPGHSMVAEDDIERLEELFNLQEPTWKAYLQWLGVRTREVDITKAEFDKDGCARLALSMGDGSSELVEVTRDADVPKFFAGPWFKQQRWRLRLESPRDRAERWARRNGVTDEAVIAERAKSSEFNRWRVVAFRKRHEGLLQGRLGLSYKYSEPVARMMLDRLPVSLYFGILGAIITYMVSVPLGVFKALHHKSWADSLTSVLIFVGYAVPGFARGAVMLVYRGAQLEWFPLYGLTSPGFEQMTWQERFRDLLSHTVLPLSCYVVSTFAMTTMMMKNNLMENLSADYVRTAVAKGVSFRRAVWGHAFRNSFIPIASTLGSVICTVVGGSILIERVFDIQGFGMLSYQALMDKDYSLIMGTLLLMSVLIIVGNLLSDILVALIDPRVKFD